MDNYHSRSPQRAGMPINSTAGRNRFRNSPTISTIQPEKTPPSSNSNGKDTNNGHTMPSRVVRSSFQSRYQANRWSGPPSPTKGSTNQQQQFNSNSNNNKNSSNANTNNSRSVTPSTAASTKFRERAASRARGRDPPPTISSSSGAQQQQQQQLASPAKTAGTATTAPSSTTKSHPNSISLTRRRLSQPILNTPPSKKNMDTSYSRRLQSQLQQREENNNNNEDLVCDYDTSATLLYELLESSQWEEARSRCRSHPKEVRTWIIRRDKSHKVRWKLLPLHAAIIFQSPNSVVSSLLERYPHGASCPDDQGMLPLHLAFRHKQEDEDLLELLLVQYPKAVLMKDKRSRVPLEHGRESKFSAKLMWLYADATSIGTKADQPEGGATTPGGESHNDQGTASDREKELRKKFEKEMEQLRNEYENKFQSLEEKKELEAQHVKLVLDDERQTLIERHAEEMSELKEMLNQQNEREGNMVGDLQIQMDDLQVALENAQRQNDGLTMKYGKMEEFNRELRNQLQAIIRDQLFMRDLATRQNNELDAARKMRAQIIHTLMQQEDTDGENDRMRSNKLIEMAENVRDRIHDILRNDPSENFAEMEDNHDELLQTPAKNGGGGGNLGPSRIEVERGHDQGGGFIDDQQQQQQQQHHTHHHGGFFEERDDVFLAKIPEVELRESDALGDMKSLGDEISGITEHSPY